MCLAYRKGAWSLLSSGSEDVGEDFRSAHRLRVLFSYVFIREDMKSHYYGRRGVVWMRLVHNATGSRLLALYALFWSLTPEHDCALLLFLPAEESCFSPTTTGRWR